MSARKPDIKALAAEALKSERALGRLDILNISDRLRIPRKLAAEVLKEINDGRRKGKTPAPKRRRHEKETSRDGESPQNTAGDGKPESEPGSEASTGGKAPRSRKSRTSGQAAGKESESREESPGETGRVEVPPKRRVRRTRR